MNTCASRRGITTGFFRRLALLTRFGSSRALTGKEPSNFMESRQAGTPTMIRTVPLGKVYRQEQRQTLM